MYIVGDVLVLGLLVVAKWRHNGWYAAKIARMDRQRVQVDYLDGDSKMLIKTNVLPMVSHTSLASGLPSTGQPFTR